MAGPYDALIAGWNLSSASAGALPPHVTGTSLFGLTTSAKITAVTAWTIAGLVPVTTTFTGIQLLNCINYAEWAALSATQQANLWQIINNPGPMTGGTSGATLLPVGMILAYFSHSGPTVTNLTALANSIPVLWWSAPVELIAGVNNGGAGITAPISQIAAVVAAAGLS